MQDKATRDRLRRYASPIDERNLANEIDDATVQALMTACERRGALVARYYRLKAKLLGLDQLEDYDRYAPVLEAEGQRSFDAARELVLEAYGDFSPRLAEIARTLLRAPLDRRRAAPRQARRRLLRRRRSRACIPYVLLNYTGTLRDVMTLAHELGHGVHQYLSRPRGLFEMDTPLTTAETASVFGEMLTFRRLLRDEPDPAVRLGLLCGKLEDAFATVFRQVVMTRFEEKLHAARRAEGELPIPRVERALDGGEPPDVRRRRRACATTTPGGGSTSRTSCTARSTATRTPSASCSCWRWCSATTRRAPRSCRATSRCSKPAARSRRAKSSRTPASTSATRASGTSGLVLLEKMVAEAESLAAQCGKLVN